MAEKATVLSIDGAIATVELEQTGACSRCGMCSPGSRGRMQVEVDAVPGLEVGGQVLIEGGQTAWVASLLLFVVPMVDLIVGVVLGQVIDIGLSRDAASALLGGGLFAVSMVGCLLAERALRRKGTRRPHILKM